MAIPERYLALFRPELEEGETVQAVANADLWLRYRRLALTDRRLLAVERGGLRHPFRGRHMVSVPLAAIAGVSARRGPLAWHLSVRTDFNALGFALPRFARGTREFVSALRAAVARPAAR